MTIRRDPFEMMDRMFEQMRRSMMGERTPMDDDRPAFADPETGTWSGAETGMWPATGTDVRRATGGRDANLRMEQTADGYLVMADLPGFEREDITVRFEDGRLSIAAESEATEDEEFAFRRRNRRVYDELWIPGAVAEEDVSATYRNGVLEVTLPTEAGATDDDHVIDVE